MCASCPFGHIDALKKAAAFLATANSKTIFKAEAILHKVTAASYRCIFFGVESAIGGQGERAGKEEGMQGRAVGTGLGAPPRG